MKIKHLTTEFNKNQHHFSWTEFVLIINIALNANFTSYFDFIKRKQKLLYVLVQKIFENNFDKFSFISSYSYQLNWTNHLEIIKV